MFWSKNKQIVSSEYADLLGKLTQLASENAQLKARLDVLDTNQHSLRGLVNRKLGKKDFGDIEEEGGDLRKEIEDLKLFFGSPVENYQSSMERNKNPYDYE